MEQIKVLNLSKLSHRYWFAQAPRDREVKGSNPAVTNSLIQVQRAFCQKELGRALRDFDRGWGQ